MIFGQLVMNPRGLLLVLASLTAAAILLFRCAGSSKTKVRSADDGELLSQDGDAIVACPGQVNAPLVISPTIASYRFLNVAKSPPDVLCTLISTTNQSLAVLATSWSGHDWHLSSHHHQASLRTSMIQCSETVCRIPLQPTGVFSSYSLISSKIDGQDKDSDNVKTDADAGVGDHALFKTRDDHRDLPAVPRMTCPEVGASPPTLLGSGTYDILKAPKDSLCLLFMTNQVDHMSPIARSYNANEWESYLKIGGKRSLDDSSPNPNCLVHAADEYCRITLPVLPPNMMYTLVSSNHSVDGPDAYARFLEMATFGTTRKDMLELMQSEVDTNVSPLTNMALWIEMQLDPSRSGITSHREFFRRRANARFESSSEYGQVTHPCQKNVLYRRFVFTDKYDEKDLRVDPHESASKKVLSVDGQVLTIVEGPAYYNSSSAEQVTISDGTYKICSRPKSGIGANLRLRVDGNCEDVGFNAIPGNPPIEFDTANEPSLVVELDGVPIVEVDQWDGTAQVIQSPQQLVDPTCNLIQMGSGRVPTVHARYNGMYWVHDPRFVLVENTVENPAPDGGGALVQATSGGTSEFEARCANKPRTFLNEEGCRMSSDVQACGYGDLQYPTDLQGVYGKGIVVCGSPGEVANDLTLHGETKRGAFDLGTDFDETSTFHEFVAQRETIWVSIAVSAKDQLRQRVAWVLYQLLIVNSSISANSITENWLNYYDIFVRNAFKNYRNVLKEIAFSRMMGTMLTYIGSKSTGYQWTRDPTIVEHADENFARELMQLFTIGLYELNPDGTRKVDETGAPVKTYSNDDIMAYARAWTGFEAQRYRGNSAAESGNRIDPMTIEPRHRDQFPKMGLQGRYIGDGYPLCADLPQHHYLKEGAKYRLMGYSTQSEMGTGDPSAWANRADQIRFAAHTGSPLYNALCSPDPFTNACRFPAVVTLQSNLDCEGAECNPEMDTVRTVKVEEHVFYEYVQPACVHAAFYPEPQKIKKRGWHSYTTMYQCADPRTEVATACCCSDFGTSLSAKMEDNYWGERLKMATARKRCARIKSENNNFDLCTSSGILSVSGGYTQMTPFFWQGDIDCFVKVKFGHDLKVSIVHHVPDEDASVDRQKLVVDQDTKTFFRVHFADPSLVQDVIQGCDSFSGCSFSSDGHCMCNTLADEHIAFEDMPTREQVLQELHIGAFPTNVYDDVYISSTSVAGVVAHHVNGILSKDSIFEVVDDTGRVQRRKNIFAVTDVVGTGLSFRTPVHFVSFAEPTLRDALYETDAALEHVLYHPSTPPFIAKHFAQRFGNSNPSPRYVRVIAEAFSSGTYSFKDEQGPVVSFGGGEYGDLKATIAAVFLDREARTVVLDADPAQGSLREPILTLTSLLRGLEYRSTAEFPFPRMQVDLQQAIGQMVYSAPSIFSFFSKDHQPDGVIASAGLVAPEAEVQTFGNVVELMNGLLAATKYGLDRCFGGLFLALNGECNERVMGVHSEGSGYLDFQPLGTTKRDIIDELARVMTAGRLSEQHRDLIEDAIADENNLSIAAVKVQQLIASSSEFHSTGVVKKTGELRQKHGQATPSTVPYKAVVMVFLKGGADTYNMIVPHSCSGTNNAGKDVRAQYDEVRGDIKIDDAHRHHFINADDSVQPCSVFALHRKLPMLETLYEAGNLSFFMNAGPLPLYANAALPFNKTTYEALTVSQLFAHNTMQEEAARVNPHNQDVPTGLLGRWVSSLNHVGNFNASAVSINHLSYSVVGGVDDSISPLPLVVDDDGPKRFNQRPSKETFEPREHIERLNGINDLSSSFHGETWSDKFTRAIDVADTLADNLELVNLATEDGHKGLNMVAKLIGARNSRGTDRDLFYVDLGSWDFHNDLERNLDGAFDDLNDAIEKFVSNVEALGLWNNVTLLVTSEFGRTLSPNTQGGTDHGWGGHYFVAGGDLKGGDILGQYPRDLTEGSPLNVGRGRMMPTLSYESMWSPLIEWSGLPRSQLSDVLPNADATNTPLFLASDLFG